MQNPHISNKQITVKSNCGSVVTVGVLTNGVSREGPEQTFDLTPGASNSFAKPDAWGGRVWARYSCSGSAGKDLTHCGTPGAANPATLAEFFFNGFGGKDYYDISLVDGYNLAMSIAPNGGTTPSGYSCGTPKCSIASCPSEYAFKDATGNVVSCLSACSKTGSAQDCCTGDHNHPELCKPSGNSLSIKQACPDAYSFAYDDQDSTYECIATGFVVTFC
ncbi:unnamed protein product [Mucor hiemalis]